ncbi:hypothetical protein GSI_14743 [Ganoderma sinense ZZ0214-1]|uniref:Uncharacterized protein n=1 Tax=Ganoderma sinense ZZ0214-1 TaxID=1077348 RepID=A0A2G8RPK0_9APHY|nr:hypothetical protein GSI_14743 [Ganoderma sinense ZZ0214-1]
MSSTAETSAASTVPESGPVNSLAPILDEQTSSTSDSNHTPELQATPEKQARIRKHPMREFKWGVSRKQFFVHFLDLTSDATMKGNLIRNALPTTTLPCWLDPMWVDIDSPTRLPLCWYGVPFVSRLFYGCAERVGLASYYTRKILASNPGDLDPYRTWGNMQEWFKKKTGLKLDLNLAWGEDGKPDVILTLWSNHDIDNITPKMWDGTFEMLDYLEYGEEYDLLWYLNHNLEQVLSDDCKQY